jgi:HD-GYP domain-containing protein (c-di-GMP phosphodiesterase class II)
MMPINSVFNRFFFWFSKHSSLDQHLFSVGVVAQEMMKNFCTDKQLHKAAFTAGCWHDIGKLEFLRVCSSTG